MRAPRGRRHAGCALVAAGASPSAPANGAVDARGLPSHTLLGRFGRAASRLPLQTINHRKDLGGAGDDNYNGGQSAAAQQVAFRGGEGFDTATYALATAGVTVLKDDQAGGDGRVALDNNRIALDVEQLIGSPLNDSLVGDDDPASTSERIFGGPGDDVINGRRGFEFYDMGSVPDGADRVSGGPDNSGFVSYSRRTAPVTVSIAGLGPSVVMEQERTLSRFAEPA